PCLGGQLSAENPLREHRLLCGPPENKRLPRGRLASQDESLGRQSLGRHDEGDTEGGFGCIDGHALCNGSDWMRLQVLPKLIPSRNYLFVVQEAIEVAAVYQVSVGVC